MDKTVKYLGGIGYILMLVGPILSVGAKVGEGVSIVGAILVAVAWVFLGRSLSDRIMVANGIMMIVGPIIVVAVTFGVILSMLPTTNQPMMHKNPTLIIQTLLSVIAVVVIIAIVCWALHVLSLLRAGNALNIGTFKYSAYCQIASFILIILAIIWLFGNVAAIVPLLQTQVSKPNPELFLKIFGPMFGLIALGGLLGIVSDILAAVAFFSIEG